MINNQLDLQDRLSSYLYCSILEHLQLITTPSRMLKASVLSGLWEMLLKAQVSNARDRQCCRILTKELLRNEPVLVNASKVLRTLIAEKYHTRVLKNILAVSERGNVQS